MKGKNNLLKAKEVSKCLGVSIRTVYRLSAQGKLKSFKIGGQWFFRKNEIDKYLNCGTDFRTVPDRSLEQPERRMYPRVNCYLGCRYYIDMPNTLKGINGKILNIGGGGLFLTDSYMVNITKIDDPVKIAFELPEDEDVKNNMVLKGRVVRKTGAGFGVKFRNISKENQDLLIRYAG